MTPTVTAKIRKRPQRTKIDINKCPLCETKFEEKQCVGCDFFQDGTIATLQRIPTYEKSGNGSSCCCILCCWTAETLSSGICKEQQIRLCESQCTYLPQYGIY